MITTHKSINESCYYFECSGHNSNTITFDCNYNTATAQKQIKVKFVTFFFFNLFIIYLGSVIVQVVLPPKLKK